MQLDHTHLAIRTRSVTELGDLSLIMLRRYPGSILIAFAIMALPWMIANAVLLQWLLHDNGDDFMRTMDGSIANRSRYVAWMLVLVIVQTPIAGVAATYYLGQAVFEARPTSAAVRTQVRKTMWRWVWVLGVVRLPIPLMIMLLFRIGSSFDFFFDVLLPVIVMITVLLVRGGRPFLPEILLLEQCPIRSKSGGEISARQRSSRLHGPMQSELNGRFVVISLVLAFLSGSLLYTAITTMSLLTGHRWVDSSLTWSLLFPLSLWAVGGISVLIRLLNYLDCRIRLEGWDVELAVKAEGIRQFGGVE